MATYVIIETDLVDVAPYERYKAASPAAVEARGGCVLARGGELDVLDGNWQPSRRVVLEFEITAAGFRDLWRGGSGHGAATLDMDSSSRSLTSSVSGRGGFSRARSRRPDTSTPSRRSNGRGLRIEIRRPAARRR